MTIKSIKVKDLYGKVVCKSNLTNDDSGKYPKPGYIHKNNLLVKDNMVKFKIIKLHQSPQYHYIKGFKNYYINYNNYNNWINGYGKERLNAVENFQNLIDNFDESKMTQIDVVLENGKYVLIDGLHRCSILYSKDKNKVIKVNVIENDNFKNLPLKKLKINHLDKLDKLGINKNDYCLIQSCWFPIMNIRENGDLDFIIRSTLIEEFKNKILKIPKLNIKINNKNYHKFGCKSDDDLIDNFSVKINGYKFCYFKFYNEIIKNRDSSIIKKDDDDVPDKINLKSFFSNEIFKNNKFKDVPINSWF